MLYYKCPICLTGEWTSENRIAQLRKKQRYSQAQLAEAAHVTRQTINAIENDKYDPSLGLAFQLAKILEVTVDELFLYEGED